jgi:hypothetical protein
MQPLDRAETFQEDSRGIGLCCGSNSDEYMFGKDLRYRLEQAI